MEEREAGRRRDRQTDRQSEERERGRKIRHPESERLTDKN